MSGPYKSQNHSWLKEAGTESEDVAEYCDNGAENYNDEVKVVYYVFQTGKVK